MKLLLELNRTGLLETFDQIVTLYLFHLDDFLEVRNLFLKLQNTQLSIIDRLLITGTRFIWTLNR
mgnify:CR=1 FL=1